MDRFEKIALQRAKERKAGWRFIKKFLEEIGIKKRIVDEKESPVSYIANLMNELEVASKGSECELTQRAQKRYQKAIDLLVKEFLEGEETYKTIYLSLDDGGKEYLSPGLAEEIKLRAFNAALSNPNYFTLCPMGGGVELLDFPNQELFNRAVGLLALVTQKTDDEYTGVRKRAEFSGEDIGRLLDFIGRSAAAENPGDILNSEQTALGVIGLFSVVAGGSSAENARKMFEELLKLEEVFYSQSEEESFGWRNSAYLYAMTETVRGNAEAIKKDDLCFLAPLIIYGANTVSGIEEWFSANAPHKVIVGIYKTEEISGWLCLYDLNGEIIVMNGVRRNFLEHPFDERSPSELYKALISCSPENSQEALFGGSCEKLTQKEKNLITKLTAVIADCLLEAVYRAAEKNAGNPGVFVGAAEELREMKDFKKNFTMGPNKNGVRKNILGRWAKRAPSNEK